MSEQQAFWQAMIVIAGALSAVITTTVGARAYAWKREADRKLLDIRRQADDAKQQAEQVSALTVAIARLADSWNRSDERASEERRRFTEVVAASADAERRLTQAVEANSEGLLATRAAVEALAQNLQASLQSLNESLADLPAARGKRAPRPAIHKISSLQAE